MSHAPEDTESPESTTRASDASESDEVSTETAGSQRPSQSPHNEVVQELSAAFSHFRRAATKALERAVSDPSVKKAGEEAERVIHKAGEEAERAVKKFGDTAEPMARQVADELSKFSRRLSDAVEGVLGPAARRARSEVEGRQASESDLEDEAENRE